MHSCSTGRGGERGGGQPRALRFATSLLMLVCLGAGTLAPTLRGQSRTDEAIAKGVDWLLKIQEVDGSWRGPDSDHYRAGMTALAVYTLVKCGLPLDHRAIQKGIAFMQHARCHRTYEAGVMLMAAQAAGKSALPGRIKKLVKFVLDNRKRDRWSYPRDSGDVVDLSITQYGVLGLRAAAAQGFKIKSEVWQEVALGLMDCQANYGGWGYRKNDGKLTSSMTVAGIGCLLVCSKQLEKARHGKRFRKRMVTHIERGLSFLERHWSVEKNLVVSDSDDETSRDRWFYYYLYGLERVGSFSGRAILAGHDWYKEGSKVLLKKQGKNGSWGTAYGERDSNTCFALLFLRRGSRSTGIAPRALAREDQLKRESAFLVGMNQANPRLAWVRTLSSDLRTRLGADERIESIEWQVDEKTFKVVTPKKGTPPASQDYLLSWPLLSNGVYKLRAVMHLVDGEGAPGDEVISNTLQVKMDGLLEPGDLETIDDAGRNLIARTEVRASASSSIAPNRDASHVADGTWSSHWLCNEDDAAPWVRIDLKVGMRARTLRFGSAHSYGGNDKDHSRPKDVSVTLNGSRKFTMTLPDDVRIRHRLDFNTLRVHSVRIDIKSHYPSKNKPRLVGIQEIELY